MASYSAIKKSDGNYEVFQDGQRISTGDASILRSYGLSENYLGSSGALLTGSSTTGNYSGLYGNSEINSDAERLARSELGSSGQSGEFQAASDSGLVDSNYINSILNDPGKIAFYTNALAYGGYSLGDILNDLKRGEMAFKGDKTAESMVLISPDLTLVQYLNTTQGAASHNQAKSFIPTAKLTGSLDPNILKYGIDIPPQIFKQLVPILDPTSQAFQDAMAQIGHQFYDLTSAQLNATTEQDKATADYNYNTWKSSLEDQYGITLSNNATKAWQQIQDLDKTYGERGIQGSGLENQEIDKTLKGARKINEGARSELSKRELDQQIKTLHATGSADDINQFLTLHPEMSAQFKPNPTMASQYEVATLSQKLFDNAKTAGQPISMADATKKAQMLHDTVLDNNGNFVSDLNKNNNTNQYKLIYGDPTPDVSQLSAARSQVIENAKNAEEGAYNTYVADAHPFSQATTQEQTQMKNDAGPITIPTPKTPTPPINTEPTPEESASMEAQLKAASKAVAGIQQKMNQPTQTSTPATQPSVYNQQQVSGTSNQTTTTSPYVIKYGDTLGAIATKNKTTVAALAKLNNISDPNKIQAGATLKFQ